jgi:hypothetical protein
MAGTTVSASVNLDSGGQAVSGINVFVDYPEGLVSIPGSGAVSTVRQRISNVPGGFLSSPNDLDYGLIEALGTGGMSELPAKIFTITFDACVGAAAPSTADFVCVVKNAVDSQGSELSGVKCSVSLP